MECARRYQWNTCYGLLVEASLCASPSTLFDWCCIKFFLQYSLTSGLNLKNKDQSEIASIAWLSISDNQESFTLFRILSIQRKMYEANKALSYFVTHNWHFRNENFLNLSSRLQPEDVREFEFSNCFYYDMVYTVRYFLLGYRRYLLLETDETLQQCRRNYRRIEIASYFVNLIPYIIAFYLSAFKYDVISRLLN